MGIRYSDVEILFFDLETSGFGRTDDILQIAMVSKDAFFNEYIRPTKDINPHATDVHGLSRHNNNLYLHGKKVKALPLKSVIMELLRFLRRLGKPCVLVAHQCGFDASRLLLKLYHLSLIDQFRGVILGFTDTLSLFKEQFPDRGGKGAFKLTSLAEDFLNISCEEIHAQAHDALYDAELLEKLALKFFSRNYLIKNHESYDSYVDRMERKEETLYYLESLRPLQGVVSKSMLERMANATIHYVTILSEYRKSDQHVINLLERGFEGRPQVVRSKKVLNNILSYLREEFNYY